MIYLVMQRSRRYAYFLLQPTHTGVYLWPPNRASHYILQLLFILSSSLCFSSPILSGRTLDVYHTSIGLNDVALVRTTLSGYIFATKAFINNRKKTSKTTIYPPYVINMLNFGPLTAEICWGVWGTPANFNGFHVFASLLDRRRSTDVNQTLYGVWPSPGLVYYVYISGGSCP